MSDAIEPLCFTVIGPPVPKARARVGKNGHHYTPTKTRDYERRIKNTAFTVRAPGHRGSAWPLYAHYSVELQISFPDARRRDADNVLKSALDACNKVLWHDDSQVKRTLVTQEIDSELPRIHMIVTVLA
jgi:Holliday junction resolvase RusA-like endonuclease